MRRAISVVAKNHEVLSTLNFHGITVYRTADNEMTLVCEIDEDDTPNALIVGPVHQWLSRGNLNVPKTAYDVVGAKSSVQREDKCETRLLVDVERGIAYAGYAALSSHTSLTADPYEHASMAEPGDNR